MKMFLLELMFGLSIWTGLTAGYWDDVTWRVSCLLGVASASALAWWTLGWSFLSASLFYGAAITAAHVALDWGTPRDTPEGRRYAEGRRRKVKRVVLVYAALALVLAPLVPGLKKPHAIREDQLPGRRLPQGVARVETPPYVGFLAVSPEVWVDWEAEKEAPSRSDRRIPINFYIVNNTYEPQPDTIWSLDIYTSAGHRAVAKWDGSTGDFQPAERKRFRFVWNGKLDDGRLAEPQDLRVQLWVKYAHEELPLKIRTIEHSSSGSNPLAGWSGGFYLLRSFHLETFRARRLSLGELQSASATP